MAYFDYSKYTLLEKIDRFTFDLNIISESKKNPSKKSIEDLKTKKALKDAGILDD